MINTKFFLFLIFTISHLIIVFKFIILTPSFSSCNDKDIFEQKVSRNNMLGIDSVLDFVKPKFIEDVDLFAHELSEKVTSSLQDIFYGHQEESLVSSTGDRIIIYRKLDIEVDRSEIINNIIQLVRSYTLEDVINSLPLSHQQISFELKTYIENLIVLNILRYNYFTKINSGVKKALGQGLNFKNTVFQKEDRESMTALMTSDENIYPKTPLTQLLLPHQFEMLQSVLNKLLYDIKNDLNYKIDQNIKNYFSETANRRFFENSKHLVNLEVGFCTLGLIGLSSLISPVSVASSLGLVGLSNYFFRPWMTKKTKERFSDLLNFNNQHSLQIIPIDQNHAGEGEFIHASEDEDFVLLDIINLDLLAWVKELEKS